MFLFDAGSWRGGAIRKLCKQYESPTAVGAERLRPQKKIIMTYLAAIRSPLPDIYFREVGTYLGNKMVIMFSGIVSHLINASVYPGAHVIEEVYSKSKAVQCRK
jgi:hypothetical protein